MSLIWIPKGKFKPKQVQSSRATTQKTIRVMGVQAAQQRRSESQRQDPLKAAPLTGEHPVFQVWDSQTNLLATKTNKWNSLIYLTKKWILKSIRKKMILIHKPAAKLT